MEQKAAILDIEKIATRTGLAKMRINSYLSLASRLETDPENKRRTEKHECKACFYDSRIGGAAMTTKPCACCGKDVMYESTATDVLCLKCAKENELCKHCGADIKLRETRKNFPFLIKETAP
ncbi:MAG: hypothetical protein ABUJ92_00275 [Desulfobacterales bacterium]